MPIPIEHIFEGDLERFSFPGNTLNESLDAMVQFYKTHAPLSDFFVEFSEWLSSKGYSRTSEFNEWYAANVGITPERVASIDPLILTNSLAKEFVPAFLAKDATEHVFEPYNDSTSLESFKIDFSALAQYAELYPSFDRSTLILNSYLMALRKAGVRFITLARLWMLFTGSDNPPESFDELEQKLDILRNTNLNIHIIRGKSERRDEKDEIRGYLAPLEILPMVMPNGERTRGVFLLQSYAAPLLDYALGQKNPGFVLADATYFRFYRLDSEGKLKRNARGNAIVFPANKKLRSLADFLYLEIINRKKGTQKSGFIWSDIFYFSPLFEIVDFSEKDTEHFSRNKKRLVEFITIILGNWSPKSGRRIAPLVYDFEFGKNKNGEFVRIDFVDPDTRTQIEGRAQLKKERLERAARRSKK